METRLRIKRNNTPYCGLTNFGSTCYFNAVLAALFGTPTFRSRVLRSQHLEHELVNAIRTLYIEMTSTKSSSLAPKDLFAKVTKLRPEWTVNDQQDAHELLNLLLNHIEETCESDQRRVKCRESFGLRHIDDDIWRLSGEISSQMIYGEKEDTDSLVELFEGQIAHTTQCLACDTASCRLERFFDLPLDIRDDIRTSIECVEQDEYMTATEKYLCDSCHLPQAAIRSSHLRRIPQILVFQLKRFRYDAVSGCLSKVSDTCSFTTELYLKIPQAGDTFFKGMRLDQGLSRMREFMETEDGEKLQVFSSASSEDQSCCESRGKDQKSHNNNKLRLKLCAVILHVGPSMFAGHYVTIIRESHSAENWYIIDDDEVTPVGPRAMERFLMNETATGLPGFVDARNAYLLFYELVR